MHVQRKSRSDRKTRKLLVGTGNQTLRDSRRTSLALATAVATIIFGSASAHANTADNFTGGATTSILSGTNWASTPALPDVTNDAVFTATTGIRTMTAGNLTVGSFNVTATSGTFSIRNATSLATDSFLTLGGASGSNSVSGTASTDLLYTATGSTFSILGDNGGSGSGVVKLVLAQDGSFNAAGTGTINVTSITSGAFNLTKTGTGTLTLAGANTFGGVGKSVTLSAGILNINSATALGDAANTLVIAGGTTINNTSGADVTTSDYAQSWNGNFTFSGSGNLHLGNGAVTLAGNTGIVLSSVTNSLTVGGAIGGGSSELKKSGGILVLAGANTYSGNTTQASGILVLSGTNNSNGNTVLTSGTLVLGTGSVANIVSGTNTNGLAGGIITMAGGATIRSSDNSLRTVTNSITIVNGVVWGAAEGATTGLGDLTFTGSITGGSGVNMTVNNQTTVTIASFSFGNAFSKFGTGTLVFSGVSNTNVNKPVTAAAGVLALAKLADGGAASSIGITTAVASNLFIGSTTTSGTLKYIGTGDSTNRLFTINNFGGSLDASGTGAINFTGTGSIVLQEPGTSSTGSYTLNSTTVSTLGTGFTNNLSVGEVINNPNLPLGTTVASIVNTTTITVSAAATSTGTGTTTFSFNRTLTLTGSNTGANDFKPILADSSAGSVLSVTKSGIGTWILSGPNTYTGATTVSQGKLIVNGSLVAGSATTIASGATLGGNGTVSGSVATTSSTSIIAPGSTNGLSASTLTIGSLDASAGARFAMQLGNTTATNVSDKLIISGGLTDTGTGGLVLDISGVSSGTSGVQTGVVYTLITFGASTNQLNYADFASPVLQSGLVLDTTFGTGGILLSTGGLGGAGDIEVRFSSVPEPTSLATFGLAAFGLLSRRRRRLSGAAAGKRGFEGM